MDFHFFLKGVIIGFSIAAPVGPIGIKCIRKTLQFGRLSGFFSGLGAAFADTVYGTIAAFGLSLISDFLVSKQLWLRLIGGIVLVCLGGKIFSSKPAVKSEEVSHLSLIKDFFTTFFLTMTNPMTLLAYLAVFAGIGFTNNHDNYPNARWLVLGVFTGSTFWWMLLTEGIALFRKKVNRKVMIGINRVAGLTIATFGVLALISLFL